MNDNKTKREYKTILNFGADCGQFFINNRELKHNDGKGGENVTQKVNSRGFKLHRSYSNIFNLSNIGDFFGSWIRKECIQVQKKQKEKIVVLCSRPP